MSDFNSFTDLRDLTTCDICGNQALRVCRVCGKNICVAHARSKIDTENNDEVTFVCPEHGGS